MLGLLAPRLPNGDVLVFAKEAKPELANADADVFGFSLPDVVLCGVVSSLSEITFVVGVVTASA